jgi:hypothetical protein
MKNNAKINTIPGVRLAVFELDAMQNFHIQLISTGFSSLSTNYEKNNTNNAKLA